jgi:Relaxase/Mobilisation nuclease domain
MIIKGNPGGSVKFWSKHLLRDDTNEKAEVKEIAGLLAEDLPSALKEMRAIAAQSRSQGNFMYQANINPLAHEHLTPEQWMEAVDTLEKNLGLEGHQRVVIEHVKEGRQHYHVVWNRVDVETLRVADMGGNWPIHEKTARELEARFGLSPTPSPDKEKIDDRKSAPELYEIRAAERSGIDPKAMKAELTELWRKSEDGKSFAAAIEERGYILAKGDRRDFCVVDRAGDAHSLARRLDGVRAKDVREHMADIDREALPSVGEARATQHSIEKANSAPELRGTAAEIRLNWSLSYSAEGFVAAIEDRHLSLARVGENDEHQSRTAHAFAKEIGRYAPSYVQGEIVVVNRFGDVYRIDERTTGNTRSEIEKHLGAIDREALPTVTETRETQRETGEALRQIKDAARADNATIRAAENELFANERRERKEAATAAATEKWEARAEADRARIDPVDLTDIATKPALVVLDVAGGVAESLLDFVGGLLGSSRPPQPEFSSAASLQQFRAQREAVAALEGIRHSMERGEGLSASDIRHLTPIHLENIKLRGDDYLRELVESLQRDREHEIDYGRVRER